MRTLCVVTSALFFSLTAPALTLVRNGTSTYSIVLPQPAIPAEQHAAKELQSFLEEISGAQLPIVTKCGTGPCIVLQPDAAHLGAEESILRTSGANLIISGGRPRGILYGVYGFLDQLGCRWYTSEVSRIPKLPTIELQPMDRRLRPDFEYREPFYTEAFERDWAVRNRVNGNSMHLDDSVGGRFAYYPFVHSFDALVAPAKYFDAHPEYFSLVDGKRKPSQLCLTNPEVLRIATATVMEWIRTHPEASIYTVSQNDGRGWCECDRCLKLEREEGGQHSGPILHFVNAVAAEVEKKYPGRLIDTLAYYYTDIPPAHVRPRPNVRIRLCPINNCQAHRYDDPRCPHNRPFMANLRGWSAITNQLYVWHYNTNFHHYTLPFPDYDEFISDIPLYKRSGVVGVFFEGAYPPGGGGEMAELKSWVMARMLWDSKADGYKLVDEFLQAVYGKASPYLRAYIGRMNREVRFAPEGRGMHLWISGMPLFSGNFVPDSLELFRKAEAAADSDAIRRRVEKQRLAVDYARLFRQREFRVEGASYAPAGWQDLKAHTLAFLQKMRSFGIQCNREGGMLDWDENQARTFIRPFPVVTLQDAKLRIDFAPELSGRAVRFLDKTSGTDLLRELDPAEPDYPNNGGLLAAVGTDFRGKDWPITWTIERNAAPREIVFAGATTAGLALTRTVSLQNGTLRTRTVLRNTGTGPQELVLRTRGEFRAEEMRWEVTRSNGIAEALSLLKPGGETNGLNPYWADERPAGQWRIPYARLGIALVNRFVREQTAQCLMGWTAKDRPRISFTLFTPRTNLQPGATLALDSDYQLTAMPGTAH